MANGRQVEFGVLGGESRPKAVAVTPTKIGEKAVLELQESLNNVVKEIAGLRKYSLGVCVPKKARVLEDLHAQADRMDAALKRMRLSEIPLVGERYRNETEMIMGNIAEARKLLAAGNLGSGDALLTQANAQISGMGAVFEVEIAILRSDLPPGMQIPGMKEGLLDAVEASIQDMGTSNNSRGAAIVRAARLIVSFSELSNAGVEGALEAAAKLYDFITARGAQAIRKEAYAAEAADLEFLNSMDTALAAFREEKKKIIDNVLVVWDASLAGYLQIVAEEQAAKMGDALHKDVDAALMRLRKGREVSLEEMDALAARMAMLPKVKQPAPFVLASQLEAEQQDTRTLVSELRASATSLRGEGQTPLQGSPEWYGQLALGAVQRAEQAIRKNDYETARKEAGRASFALSAGLSDACGNLSPEAAIAIADITAGKEAGPAGLKSLNSEFSIARIKAQLDGIAKEIEALIGRAETLEPISGKWALTRLERLEAWRTALVKLLERASGSEDLMKSDGRTPSYIDNYAALLSELDRERRTTALSSMLQGQLELNQQYLQLAKGDNAVVRELNRSGKEMENAMLQLQMGGFQGALESYGAALEARAGAIILRTAKLTREEELYPQIQKYISTQREVFRDVMLGTVPQTEEGGRKLQDRLKGAYTAEYAVFATPSKPKYADIQAAIRRNVEKGDLATAEKGLQEILRDIRNKEFAVRATITVAGAAAFFIPVAGPWISAGVFIGQGTYSAVAEYRKTGHVSPATAVMLGINLVPGIGIAGKALTGSRIFTDAVYAAGAGAMLWAGYNTVNMYGMASRTMDPYEREALMHEAILSTGMLFFPLAAGGRRYLPAIRKQAGAAYAAAREHLLNAADIMLARPQGLQLAYARTSAGRAAIQADFAEMVGGRAYMSGAPQLRAGAWWNPRSWGRGKAPAKAGAKIGAPVPARKPGEAQQGKAIAGPATAEPVTGAAKPTEVPAATKFQSEYLDAAGRNFEGMLVNAGRAGEVKEVVRAIYNRANLRAKRGDIRALSDAEAAEYWTLLEKTYARPGVREAHMNDAEMAAIVRNVDRGAARYQAGRREVSVGALRGRLGSEIFTESDGRLIVDALEVENAARGRGAEAPMTYSNRLLGMDGQNAPQQTAMLNLLKKNGMTSADAMSAEFLNANARATVRLGEMRTSGQVAEAARNEIVRQLAPNAPTQPKTLDDAILNALKSDAVYNSVKDVHGQRAADAFRGAVSGAQNADGALAALEGAKTVKSTKLEATTQVIPDRTIGELSQFITDARAGLADDFASIANLAEEVTGSIATARQDIGRAGAGVRTQVLPQGMVPVAERAGKAAGEAWKYAGPGAGIARKGIKIVKERPRIAETRRAAAGAWVAGTALVGAQLAVWGAEIYGGWQGIKEGLVDEVFAKETSKNANAMIARGTGVNPGLSQEEANFITKDRVGKEFFGYMKAGFPAEDKAWIAKRALNPEAALVDSRMWVKPAMLGYAISDAMAMGGRLDDINRLLAVTDEAEKKAGLEKILSPMGITYDNVDALLKEKNKATVDIKDMADLRMSDWRRRGIAVRFSDWAAEKFLSECGVTVGPYDEKAKTRPESAELTFLGNSPQQFYYLIVAKGRGDIPRTYVKDLLNDGGRDAFLAELGRHYTGQTNTAPESTYFFAAPIAKGSLLSLLDAETADPVTGPIVRSLLEKCKESSTVMEAFNRFTLQPGERLYGSRQELAPLVAKHLNEAQDEAVEQKYIGKTAGGSYEIKMREQFSLCIQKHMDAAVAEARLTGLVGPEILAKVDPTLARHDADNAEQNAARVAFVNMVSMDKVGLAAWIEKYQDRIGPEKPGWWQKGPLKGPTGRVDEPLAAIIDDIKANKGRDLDVTAMSQREREEAIGDVLRYADEQTRSYRDKRWWHGDTPSEKAERDQKKTRRKEEGEVELDLTVKPRAAAPPAGPTREEVQAEKTFWDGNIDFAVRVGGALQFLYEQQVVKEAYPGGVEEAKAGLKSEIYRLISKGEISYDKNRQDTWPETIKGIQPRLVEFAQKQAKKKTEG